MSNDKRLTLDDPVPIEIIQKFQQINEAQAAIGMELLRLEKRKVFLLASSKKLGDEHDRLFGGLLIERGLAPNLPVELDVGSRKLIPKDRPPQAAKAAEPEAPPAELPVENEG